MKDTTEFVIPGDSVFLEMEEFHKTESPKDWSYIICARYTVYPKKKEIRACKTAAFEGWGKKYTKGIPTTCTLN